MKNFFLIAMLAVAALSVSCSKENKATSRPHTPSTDSQMVGTWYCYKVAYGEILMEDPGIVITFDSDNNYKLYNPNNLREGTWLVDGGYLVFQGAYSARDSIMILDGTHLCLHEAYMDLYYTKIEELVTGSWRCGEMQVTNHASGAASVDGVEGEVTWSLSINNNAKAVINYAGAYEESFAITYVQDYLFGVTDGKGNNGLFRSTAPRSFKVNNIIGTWMRSGWRNFGTESSDYRVSSCIFAPDNTCVLSWTGVANNASDNHWSVSKYDGIYDLRIIDSNGPSLYTMEYLDEKHMALLSRDNFLSVFTNISTLLPGKWKISWTDRWYIVTIDDSGSSSWLMEGTVDVGKYAWSLDIVKGNALIKFTGPGWQDEITIQTIVTDELLVANNAANGKVTFERQ